MSGGGGAAAPRMESVNSELLTLTYGALVSQLIKDFEDPREVNTQLEAMGHNIGVRLVDEFCAKSRAGSKCRNFRETMDAVAKEAFRMFLGAPAVVGDFSADGSACTLRIPDNPLAGAARCLQKSARRPFSPPPFQHPPPTPTPLPAPRRLCGAARRVRRAALQQHPVRRDSGCIGNGVAARVLHVCKGRAGRR